MTGLIHKESSFIKTAVSPTGAAGLTQFTAIGLKEVNDQFGMRGKMGAPEIVTLYFLTQTRSCIDSEWVELWRKIDVQETDPTFYPLLKEQLKKAISRLYKCIMAKKATLVLNMLKMSLKTCRLLIQNQSISHISKSNFYIPIKS